MTSEEIQNLISENIVVIFGKGEKGAPRCGFTAQVQYIFDELYPEYVMINILPDLELKEMMKEFSDWPTFPQVYVNGRFIGGCDITTDVYESGELQKMLPPA